MKLDKVLYTATAEAVGGREGYVKSDDGALDMPLTTPKALGGEGKFGVNPEQMFAAGYAACFIGALKVVLGKQGKKLPEDTHVSADIAIGPIAQGFNIAAVLNITLPAIEPAVAQQLIDDAHQVCPYSNATRGNIEVTLNLVS